MALTLAALKDLQVKCGDAENACITAPAWEKIWTILRPEHREDTGEKATIVRALHGLKSSGAAPRARLDQFMHSLGCESSLADPDLRLKA